MKLRGLVLLIVGLIVLITFGSELITTPADIISTSQFAYNEGSAVDFSTPISDTGYRLTSTSGTSTKTTGYAYLGKLDDPFILVSGNELDETSGSDTLFVLGDVRTFDSDDYTKLKNALMSDLQIDNDADFNSTLTPYLISVRQTGPDALAKDTQYNGIFCGIGAVITVIGLVMLVRGFKRGGGNKNSYS